MLIHLYCHKFANINRENRCILCIIQKSSFYVSIGSFGKFVLQTSFLRTVAYSSYQHKPVIIIIIKIFENPFKCINKNPFDFNYRLTGERRWSKCKLLTNFSKVIAVYPFSPVSSVNHYPVWNIRANGCWTRWTELIKRSGETVDTKLQPLTNYLNPLCPVRHFPVPTLKPHESRVTLINVTFKEVQLRWQKHKEVLIGH